MQLSPEAKHLVARLLTADPAKRITIPEILAHPWMRIGMPAALLQINDMVSSCILASSHWEAAAARVVHRCWVSGRGRGI